MLSVHINPLHHSEASLAITLIFLRLRRGYRVVSVRNLDRPAIFCIECAQELFVPLLFFMYITTARVLSGSQFSHFFSMTKGPYFVIFIFLSFQHDKG